jgi:inorganic pyrophosphatase
MKVKLVKAYKADLDGFYSSVKLIDELDKTFLDNQHTYFRTYNAAKKHVVATLKDMIVQYKKNLSEVKALKPEAKLNLNK